MIYVTSMLILMASMGESGSDLNKGGHRSVIKMHIDREEHGACKRLNWCILVAFRYYIARYTGVHMWSIFRVELCTTWHRLCDP